MSSETRKIQIRINGQDVDFKGDPDIPLLYALRGTLGLKGTRFGCGQGGCGACTVILDGRAVQSCDMRVSAAAGRSIETIEGHGDDPVVAALIDGQAGQCGYCLPGIVMAARAFLARNPRPTREAIAEALDGNLCRCGAQLRILDALERVAAQMAEDRP